MIARSPTPRWRVPLYALIVLLAAGLTVGLAGCGGGGDEGPAQQDERQQQDEQDQQPQDDQESDESTQEEQPDEPEDEEADDQETGEATDEASDLVDRGQMVAQNNGCLGCHSTDGSQMVGPTWQDAYGHDVTLQNGETVTADEDYIRESIRDPSAKVVQGFSPSMPSYPESQISADDVEALIAYIRSLSDASDADGNGGDE